MDLTEGSKMLAKPNLMPGENPKENTQDSEHGETLKSRITNYLPISVYRSKPCDIADQLILLHVLCFRV
jgi:hypothetical protein